MNAPAAHPHHVLSLRLAAMLRAARACAGALASTSSAANMPELRAASAFACGCMRASRPSRPLLAG